MPRALTGIVVALLAAGCGTPSLVETRVVYSDDGYSELRVPAPWSSRADLGQSATLRVADPAFTRATRRVVARTVGGNVGLENIEVVKRLVIVTDPKTLLPYRVQSTETKNIAVRAGGESHTSREVQETRTVYDYGR